MNRNFNDINSQLKALESLIDRFECLKQTINRYGISAPMMKAIDPHNELVDKGICCNYEELSDIAVKDDNASRTVEGLGVLIIIGLIAWFSLRSKSMDKKIEELHDTAEEVESDVDSNITSIENDLKTLRAKKSKFDQSKIAEEFRRKVYSRETFKHVLRVTDVLLRIINEDKLANAFKDIVSSVSHSSIDNSRIEHSLRNVADSLKSIINDSDFTGLELELDSNGVYDINYSYTPLHDEERGSLGSLGWNVDSIEHAMVDTIRLLTNIKDIVKRVEQTSKSYKTSIATLKSYLKPSDEVSEDYQRDFKYAVNNAQYIIRLNDILIEIILKLLNKIIHSVTVLGYINSNV